MNDRRRALRLSARDDDLLVEAASLQGMSVTEFVLGSAIADAERTVDAHRSVVLSSTPYARFLQALDEPSGPPRQLVRQLRRAHALSHPG